MSGAAAEKHMPDATGPSQPANAEASGRPASRRHASSMYRCRRYRRYGEALKPTPIAIKYPSDKEQMKSFSKVYVVWNIVVMTQPVWLLLMLKVT